MSKSSLQLFGVVPDKGKKGKPALLDEYGVLVSPTASYDLANIRAWLKETGVGSAEKNSSFWKDWEKIRTMSGYEMRRDQLLHYFSTYGLEWFDIDAVKEGLVYIPEGTFNTSVPLALKLIDTVEPQVLIDRCFSLLNSGMALSQETIGNVVSVLGECGYMITGEEVIKNREAEILFYVISGKLPVGSLTLFRYLVYHFTDQSMVINDEKTREAIQKSAKRLPEMSEKQLIALARDFNRYKDLWMAIKLAHPRNRTIVNHISKLSKKYHKPMPDVVMNNLTSKYYSPDEVVAAARKATVFQLVRVVNALRLRREKPQGMVYRIRNSKLWTKLVAPSTSTHNRYVEELLIGELRHRFADVKAYTENFVDYAFPLTEKAFVGNIPDGTILRFPKATDLLLVGVHWTEPNTDLDLRAESSSFSVGWNTNFRTQNRGLMHSGDMTRAPAPYGASEWLFCQHLAGSYNIKLNVFSAGRGFDKKFKFIIGRSTNKPEKNYHIAPQDVLVSYVVELGDERQVNLGMLYDDPDTVYMLLGTGGSGRGRVGRWTKYDGVQQEVAFKKIQSALRLSDVVRFVDDPEDATVNLSLATLAKDSFLQILK